MFRTTSDISLAYSAMRRMLSISSLMLTISSILLSCVRSMASFSYLCAW